MFDVIPFSTIISFIFYLLKSPISSSLRQWLFQLVTAHQKYNHRSLPVRPKFGAAILITTFTCKLQSTRVELSRRQHYHNYQHFPIQPKPPKKHRSRITRGPSRESLRDYLIFFFFLFRGLVFSSRSQFCARILRTTFWCNKSLSWHFPVKLAEGSTAQDLAMTRR